MFVKIPGAVLISLFFFSPRGEYSCAYYHSKWHLWQYRHRLDNGSARSRPAPWCQQWADNSSNRVCEHVTWGGEQELHCAGNDFCFSAVQFCLLFCLNLFVIAYRYTEFNASICAGFCISPDMMRSNPWVYSQLSWPMTLKKEWPWTVVWASSGFMGGTSVKTVKWKKCEPTQCNTFFFYFTFYFFTFYCIVPMGFFPWKVWVAFPGKSQLQQSHATQPRVHA